MKIFKGQNLLEFAEHFKTDLDCEKYLLHWKWGQGYSCRKCGHTKYQVREDFSRTCNICSDTESPSSGNLFHRVKFGLRKAFFICFEMSTATKDLSAVQMRSVMGVAENTAHLFMHKVREAMKSDEKDGMKGLVQIDGSTVGGKEDGKQGRSYDAKKKKVVCAVELTSKGKVKRFYALKIQDFPAKSLRTIFDKPINRSAQVVTDDWKGYRPIKDFDITQVPSNKGKDFPVLHTMIHQVKSWLRTTYSWVSDSNINRYLSEFCFRINRSQSKQTIFNNLIKRMVARNPISQADLVWS